MVYQLRCVSCQPENPNEQNLPQPSLGPLTKYRAQLRVWAIHIWLKDGVVEDGAFEGRTKPEAAPIEGALRQGLPAVVGEGR